MQASHLFQLKSSAPDKGIRLWVWLGLWLLHLLFLLSYGSRSFARVGALAAHHYWCAIFASRTCRTYHGLFSYILVDLENGVSTRAGLGESREAGPIFAGCRFPVHSQREVVDCQHFLMGYQF